MTDRSPTTAEDNLILGRHSAAEIDAARHRVRAYFAPDQQDDERQLHAADVRLLLADLERARVNIGDLQRYLRGEKHHHDNDVKRLTAERDQARAEVKQLRTYADTARHHQQQHAETYRELAKARADLETARSERN